MGRAATAHRAWLLAALLLSFLPVQFAPVAPAVRGPTPYEQELPDGPQTAEEEKKLHQFGLSRSRRLRMFPRNNGALSLSRLSWLHSVPLESLVHEDPRHCLLPRWTAPPEPGTHA